MKFIIFCLVAICLSSAAGSHNRTTKFLPEGRITSAQNAAEGQFPHMVALYRVIDPINEIYKLCGGSLIGNKWILTAAHCLEDTTLVYVYLGATDVRNSEVSFSVSSENFIKHPEYENFFLDHDIGLIHIPFVGYTEKIKAVRLPPLASSQTYSGQIAEMSGWGATSDNNINPVNHLQWSTFKVIDNPVCKKEYERPIFSTNICIATAGGISPCDGDSGGPLVIKSKDTYTQIGIHSFTHVSGCQKGKPVVFTRLTSYVKWIKEQTGISY